MEKNLVNQLLDCDFANPDKYYGFYDWFCSEKALAGRSQKLMKKLGQVLEANKTGHKFNPEKVYVIFKNNCPMDGKLYDDFRICDFEGNVVYTVAPFQGYNGPSYGTAIVWDGSIKDYAVEDGTWEQVIAFFSGK